MELKNKVSAIVPCYNCKDYILETVESLINQTIKPLEIILVNDGSNDSTIDVLRRLEKNYIDLIKVIDLEENKGVSYARNYGVKKSKGNYILFMDSDDTVEHSLIKEYQERLKELENTREVKYILCYSSYVQIDEYSNIISKPIEGIQVKPKEILGYEFVRNNISTSGVMLNKNCFIKVNGFNEKLRYSEDWDLWLKLAGVGGFAYVKKTLVNVRRYKSNVSSGIKDMLEGEKTVLEQYNTDYIKQAVYRRELDMEINIIDYVSILYRIERWEDGFKELNNLLEEGCNFYNLYFYLGLYYLKRENFDKAFEFFEKTIELKPDHGAAINNIGALYLFEGKKIYSRKYLLRAIGLFKSYMDAKSNFELLNKEDISLDELNFTWRELRKVLTSYSS